MSWATHAIQELKNGRSAKVRPFGHSMEGRIESGQEVTLHPILDHELEVDDIVLVRYGKYDYLHLIKARKGNQYLIGNNKGRINGWVPKSNIYGILKDAE